MPEICKTDLAIVINLLEYSAKILRTLPSTVCANSARRINKITIKLKKIKDYDKD